MVRLLDFSGRGPDYGSMVAPVGAEFTITAEPNVPLRRNSDGQGRVTDFDLEAEV